MFMWGVCVCVYVCVCVCMCVCVCVCVYKYMGMTILHYLNGPYIYFIYSSLQCYFIYKIDSSGGNM